MASCSGRALLFLELSFIKGTKCQSWWLHPHYLTLTGCLTSNCHLGLRLLKHGFWVYEHPALLQSSLDSVLTCFLIRVFQSLVWLCVPLIPSLVRGLWVWCLLGKARKVIVNSVTPFFQTLDFSSAPSSMPYRWSHLLVYLLSLPTLTPHPSPAAHQMQQSTLEGEEAWIICIMWSTSCVVSALVAIEGLRSPGGLCFCPTSFLPQFWSAAGSTLDYARVWFLISLYPGALLSLMILS